MVKKNKTKILSNNNLSMPTAYILVNCTLGSEEKIISIVLIRIIDHPIIPIII